MKIRTIIASLAVAWLSTWATGALAAETEPGQWAWGFYGGAYIPEPDVIDTGPTGGLRLGYRASEHIGYSGSLGYASLDGDVGAGVDRLEADLDLMLVDFNVWYLFRPDSRLSFTIGAGPGYAWLNGDVKDSTGTNVPGGNISEDSLTFNLAIGPIIKLGERANLRLLTRLRYFDERDDDEMDKEITLGVMFPLGKKEEPAPVAAAPPPPPPRPVAPAPPPKCSDGDNDGVCDAQDACPATPAGKRVGPAGCDCDYTLNLHFALNSADLTAEDKAELDKLATVLNNPKLGFVAGEVEGHTDSSGTEEYNQALSMRRAEAVTDYLKSQGVKLSDRFRAQGYGESKPVADNATKEGRAENRRVVIKRTDCGPS